MGVFGSHNGVSGDILVQGLTVTYLADLWEPVEGISDLVRDGGEAWDDSNVAEVCEMGR